jgi:hypothetical protein
MSTGRKADSRPEIVIEFLYLFVAGNLHDVENCYSGNAILPVLDEAQSVNKFDEI